MLMKKRKKENVDKNALAIFIKNPVLGKAKTRIAKDSSDERALKVYKKLLSITHKITSKVDCNRYLFYDQFIDESDIWEPQIFNKKLQAGNDLGEKMFSAFSVLNNEKNENCLLIGSDCPYINPTLIEKAFKALDSNDFVLGPTYDGGYYLIGMKKASNLVFTDIEWSQETVLEKTIDRILAIGGKFELLQQLNDIDHLEDWLEFKSKLN